MGRRAAMTTHRVKGPTSVGGLLHHPVDQFRPVPPPHRRVITTRIIITTATPGKQQRAPKARASPRHRSTALSKGPPVKRSAAASQQPDASGLPNSGHAAPTHRRRRADQHRALPQDEPPERDVGCRQSARNQKRKRDQLGPFTIRHECPHRPQCRTSP